MPHDDPNDLTEDEREYFGALNSAFDVAERCRRLRERNFPVERDALGIVINTLMTELWDRAFSQSEIRTAFMSALQDMNRYAAGQEQRVSQQ